MEKLVFIIDLDGTVWEDVPNEIAHSHTEKAKVFDNAIEWINKKYDEGNYICLFTARTEALKKITEDKLNAIGVKYHQLMLVLACQPNIQFSLSVPVVYRKASILFLFSEFQ